MRYGASGLAEGADLTLDGAAQPVVSKLAYTRDGQVARVTYGDEGATGPGHAATYSETFYDAKRRWPVRMHTLRTAASSAPAGSLGAVTTVADQSLTWDEVGNLTAVLDRRSGDDWPSGHRPQSTQIDHDALYRVAGAAFSYTQPGGAKGLDAASDWRQTQAAHRAADPLQEGAADMVADMPPDRVQDLRYRHDWLANMAGTTTPTLSSSAPSEASSTAATCSTQAPPTPVRAPSTSRPTWTPPHPPTWVATCASPTASAATWPP